MPPQKLVELAIPTRENEENALAASGPETPLLLIEPIARIVGILGTKFELVLDDLLRMLRHRACARPIAVLKFTVLILRGVDFAASAIFNAMRATCVVLFHKKFRGERKVLLAN